MKINLIGPQSEEQSRDVDYQKTQNWYPSAAPSGRNQIVLYPTPGLKSFTTCGSGPIRGSIVFDDLLWVVSGDTLFSIDSAGTATSRGTLNTSGGRVVMAHNGADNGEEIIMVDGTNGYTWDNSTSTFAVISDGDFPDTATHVKFFDGFFLVNDPTNAGRFYRSGSYDGTTWGATDFATAERDPDELQAIEISGREIWLFGKNTTEFWYNSGAATFPFEPIQNAFIEWGTDAPYSVAQSEGTVFWLARSESGSAVIFKATGFQPQVISSLAITNELSEMTLTNAEGYVMKWYGHLWYVLHFPTDDRTLVYDDLMQAWFEWSTDGGRHLSNTHNFVFGKHLVGDAVENKIYELDKDTFTDDGTTITRTRRSAFIHSDDTPLFHRSLWVETETGVGNFTDDSPDLMLRWSDDGGYTWSNEYWRTLGATGEYSKSAVWRKLGRSYKRIYELKFTDNLYCNIIGAYARIDPASRETVDTEKK